MINNMGQAHNLSPAILNKLAKAVNKPWGGFTVKTTDPGAGTSPPNSYLVGIPEHGQNDMALPITTQQIDDFATSRADALEIPTHYLGGYNNTKKAEEGGLPGSLDVTKAYPMSEGLFMPMMQARHGWPTPQTGSFRPEDAVGYSDSTGEYEDEIPTYDPIRAYGGATAFDEEQSS